MIGAVIGLIVGVIAGGFGLWCLQGTQVETFCYDEGKTFMLLPLKPHPSGARPRISLLVPPFSLASWECASFGILGFGRTPEEAYRHWQDAFDMQRPGFAVIGKGLK
jgi:hypothetical protein